MIFFTICLHKSYLSKNLLNSKQILFLMKEISFSIPYHKSRNSSLVRFLFSLPQSRSYDDVLLYYENKIGAILYLCQSRL